MPLATCILLLDGHTHLYIVWQLSENVCMFKMFLGMASPSVVVMPTQTGHKGTLLFVYVMHLIFILLQCLHKRWFSFDWIVEPVLIKKITIWFLVWWLLKNWCIYLYKNGLLPERQSCTRTVSFLFHNLYQVQIQSR